MSDPVTRTELRELLSHYVARDELERVLARMADLDSLSDIVILVEAEAGRVDERVKALEGPVLKGLGGRDPHITAVPSNTDRINRVEETNNTSDNIAHIIPNLLDKIAGYGNRAAFVVVLVVFLIFTVWQDGCTKMIDFGTHVVDRVLVATPDTSTSGVEVPMVPTDTAPADTTGP